MTAYVTPTEADTYFESHLHTDAWDQAITTDRVKALAMATRNIDRLDFTNQKVDVDQELEFPRGDQTEVPDDIESACCELALSILDGNDPDELLADLSVKNEGFSSVRAAYNREILPEYIINGIVSATAWRYLRPYLHANGNMRIERVS